MVKIGAFQEYKINLQALHEYLPWGGLIHPKIIKNKDESLMGFITYKSLNMITIPNAKINTFGNGWALWIEKQHFNNENQYMVTLCWNPFFDANNFVSNTFDKKKIDRSNTANYFLEILQQLQEDLSSVVTCNILENAEILSYLASTISTCKESFELPEVPLYLDALLSQDVDFKMSHNNVININNKIVSVVTLLNFPDVPIMGSLFEEFKQYTYRFSRRFLFLSEKSAQKELKNYTSNWCSGRSAMLKFMRDGLLGELNGYHTNAFVFLADEEESKRILKKVAEVLQYMELPYIIENYNRKDTWWGSLPGLFRANITPPLTFVTHLGELLLVPEEGGKQDVSTRSVSST